MAYELLKDKRQLREADEKQQTEEEKQKAAQTNTSNTPYVEEEMSGDPSAVPPLKNQANIPIADGAIPADDAGIAGGAYDPLDPIGNAEIKFEQGNYQTVVGLPKVTADKTAQLTQTFVPLVEVALVELLGSTQMYKRQLAQITPSFDQQGKIALEFVFQYVVQSWIGSDIDLEAIQHDANYVLEKAAPVKAKISKCEIDTGAGTLVIMGSL